MRLNVGFWIFLCAALTVAGLANAVPGAADDSASVAARYHCAGGAQLTGNTNLVTWNRIAALPSAAAVRELAVSRISMLLAAGLQCKTNVSAASLLKPLVSDVLATESLGSFGGLTTNSRSFVLALRLDAKRAQLWRDNLGRAFGGAGEKFTTGEFNGWRWKAGDTNSFWIVPARDWLLVGRGDDLLPVQAEYLRQVSRQGRPGPALTDNWLEADLDGPRLAAWLPDWSRLFKPARIKIAIGTATNNLYMTARVIYPEAVPWKFSPWRRPAELVPTPLNSFTAGQDVAAFLKVDPTFSWFEDNPLTNQFYAWAQNQLPFLTYMAWPAANATNSLAKLSTNAPAALNPALKEFDGAKLVWRAQQSNLVLLNLKVIAPTLVPVHDKAGDFLLASMFPRMPRTKPAPDELWQEIIGRTNLVYYDWESTGPRLQQWRLLGRMFISRQRAQTDDMMDAIQIENNWLEKLSPLVGNTVTEITRDMPNELSVVRSSPVGFTGIEAFLFFDWLSTIGSPPANPQPPAH